MVGLSRKYIAEIISNPQSSGSKRSPLGFTIVELLIVIVVIAILAAVTIMSYNGITARAQQSKIAEDMANLQKAIVVARENTGKTMTGITNRTYTAGTCTAKSAGTDLASLDRADYCWTDYLSTLDKISTASGISVRQLVDPWGRPYLIDENESENGNCSNRDMVGVFSRPLNGSSHANEIRIPLSGYGANCS